MRLPASYHRPVSLANPPTVTVVTPSLNQGQFIAETLASVLDQGYPALEYIVQDGGSSDQTRSILEHHQRRLTAWRSEPDAGQAQAINRGFAGTRGQIMAWLNADDLLLPGALSHVAAYFERHPEVEVVYGQRVILDAQGQEIGRWILPRHDSRVLQWADFIPQETLFWRRSLWERVGGAVDERFDFAMDWDLLLRFQAAGARFACLPRFLGAFRVHACQKTCTQISLQGQKEMSLLRERVLGRVPDPLEIRRQLLGFMLAHWMAHLRFRCLPY